MVIKADALHYKTDVFSNVAVLSSLLLVTFTGYEIIDVLIFRKLYINVSSKKNKVITLKYDVSYLSKKELKDLKFSLSKVIKENQEIKRAN